MPGFHSEGPWGVSIHKARLEHTRNRLLCESMTLSLLRPRIVSRLLHPLLVAGETQHDAAEARTSTLRSSCEALLDDEPSE